VVEGLEVGLRQVEAQRHATHHRVAQAQHALTDT
jgi:hypothetical protein